MMEETEHAFKVAIVGPRDVGKTTLVRRYTDRVFVEERKRTIGDDWVMKKVAVKPTKETTRVRHVLLQLWDMPGGMICGNIFPFYMRSAQTVILAFDRARRKTFEAVPLWLRAIRRMPSNVPIILVATKKDLEPDVSAASIKHFIHQETIEEFYQTSSKTGENVDEVFQRCVSYALENL